MWVSKQLLIHWFVCFIQKTLRNTLRYYSCFYMAYQIKPKRRGAWIWICSFNTGGINNLEHQYMILSFLAWYRFFQIKNCTVFSQWWTYHFVSCWLISSLRSSNKGDFLFCRLSIHALRLTMVNCVLVTYCHFTCYTKYTVMLNNHSSTNLVVVDHIVASKLRVVN